MAVETPRDRDPLVGTRVAGRFLVEAPIARGGMGVVYRAVQEPLGRQVALKLIRSDVLDETARGRFAREARLISTVADPRVVTVFDFGETEDGALFLAMELLDGETLRTRLRRGALRWHELFPIALDIAAGLAAAHARGVVHRDLKPDNVMLVPIAEDGGAGRTAVRILDFGLAKEISDLLGDTPTLTHSGGLVGTPGYLAPETIHGAAESPRMDVYALGVLLWECLVGHHPFAAETPLKTIVRASQEDVPPLEDGTRKLPELPPGVTALISQLTARDPAQRIMDGAAALRALIAIGTAGSEDIAATALLTASLSMGPLPTGAFFKSDASLPLTRAASQHGSAPASVARGTGPLVALSLGGAVLAVLVWLGLRAPAAHPASSSSASAHLTAAASALQTGNAVDARIELRAAIELDDNPRARALWSASMRSGELVRARLDGRATGVVFIDETHVAVSNRNRAVEIFDLASGERARQRFASDELVDIDGRGGVLATCDLSGMVRLSGAEERTLQAPAADCRAVSIRDDIVWAAPNDMKVVAWAKGRVTEVAVPSTPSALVAARGGLAIVGNMESISVIALGDGEPSVHTVPSPDDVISLAVPDAGDALFVGANSGAVYRLPLAASGALGTPERLRRHGARVEALAISPDGRLLASAGAHEPVRIGPPTGPPLLALIDGPRSPLGLAFSPSGRFLAVIARDALRIVDLAALLSPEAPVVGHTRPVEAVAVHGKEVWTGGGDGRVIRWDLEGGRGVPLFAFDGTIVEDLDISNDGHDLVAALSDGRVVILDVADGRTRGGWLHGGGAVSARFSADGRHLVSGGRDGRVLIAERDALTPELVMQIDQTTPTAYAVAVRDDGLVATGLSGGRVLFNRPGVHIEMSKACSTVFTLRFTADGRLAVPCNDGRLEVHSLDGSGAPLSSTAPTRIYDVDVQGEQILVAGHAGTFVGPLTLLAHRLPGPLASNRARFAPGGIVSGSDDGTLRFWPDPSAPHPFDLDVPRLASLQGNAALVDVSQLDEADDLVCLRTRDGVSSFTSSGDALGVAPIVDALGVAANGGHCAVLTDTNVRFMRGIEETARLDVRGTAVARFGAGFVVATATHLVFLDGAGRRTMESPLDAGQPITVLLDAGARTVLAGRDDGSVTPLAIGSKAEAGRPLTDAPVSSVLSLALAADGTIAAGLANGDVLAWTSEGELLDRFHLHGPVTFVAFDERGLLAASALGDSGRALQHLHTERCALLNEVWSTARGARIDGRVAAASPPPGDRCAHPSASKPVVP